MKTESPEAKKIVVIGASGFGREALDVLVAMREFNSGLEILGVIDDSPSELNLSRLEDRGVSYLGTLADLLESDNRNAAYVLGIGNPLIRSNIVATLQDAGWNAFTAIHPAALIGTKVKVGNGVVVCAGAVISTNVQLGEHVHVNPNSTIGHDSILEEFVSVNPAAVISGEVLIRKNSLIGASATILQGIEIGESSIVGACACVTKDVRSGQIVKGIPAK